MIASIYKITNLKNQKAYIGLTVRDPDHRWWEHRSEAKKGSMFNLHQSIRKHGEDNFLFEVILQTKDKAALKELEQLMITDHQTHMSTQKGYNMTFGGDGATFANKHGAKDPNTGESLGLICLNDPRWATGEIVSCRVGARWTEESRQRFSETCLNGKKAGNNNGNAKRYQLTSPEGVVHEIYGNCQKTAESLGLKYGALYDHMDKVVPSPSKFSLHRSTPERLNTTGWRLSKIHQS